VQRDYNGLGQVTSEWQEHDGEVDAQTLRVQYSYSFAPSGTTNHSRPTGFVYPNTKDVTYGYGTGVGSRTSRVQSVSVNTLEVEQYEYLGLDTVVQKKRIDPGVTMSYAKLSGEANGDGGDKYTGLDRFGRVVDQRWWYTGGGVTADRYQYTHDRASNRTSRTNLVNSSFNETYTYDKLNQLTGFNRTGIDKSWDYDAVGNWEGVTTNSVTETRTHNAQNKLTAADGQTSPTILPGSPAPSVHSLQAVQPAASRPR
jgi:hypothetical protein